MDFNEIIFLKSMSDDWCNCCINLYPIARSVKSAAFVDNGKLKALSVSMHVELERGSRELGELLDKFTNKFNASGNTKEKLEALNKKLNDFIDDLYLERMSKNPEYNKVFEKPRRSSYGEHFDNYRPVFSVINNVKHILKSCDSSIAYVNSISKVDSVNDTRYDKTSSQNVLSNMKLVESQPYDEVFDYDEIEKYASDNKIKMGTPEYYKLIVKRIRAYKQDTISTVNKYFGKNSRFADLNIMDAIL